MYHQLFEKSIATTSTSSSAAADHCNNNNKIKFTVGTLHVNVPKHSYIYIYKYIVKIEKRGGIESKARTA